MLFQPQIYRYARRVQVVACDSPIGKLGVTVCYDVRFPELFQKLRFQHGVERGGVGTKVGVINVGYKYRYIYYIYIIRIIFEGV
jgi:hypothetical protein